MLRQVRRPSGRKRLKNKAEETRRAADINEVRDELFGAEGAWPRPAAGAGAGGICFVKARRISRGWQGGGAVVYCMVWCLPAVRDKWEQCLVVHVFPWCSLPVRHPPAFSGAHEFDPLPCLTFR